MAEQGDVRVLIVDDQIMVREGFAFVLAAQPGIEIVGTAANGRDALTKVDELRPDVVLMDIRMPEMDGLEATANIVASTQETKILILTTYDLDEYVFQALCAGASGFLLKDTSASQLADGIRLVAAGEALLAPSATRRLISEFTRMANASSTPNCRPGAMAGADLAELTGRELEVLMLIAQGYSNTEIASDLCVTESTIKTHVSKVLVKLGLRDRTQAAIFAYENGVVVVGGAR
ncbi:response regulator [Streptomyces collinus]|uniref:response regulator n=1 Tax=Streptomyces collinus TaxID=42684 RepID=UPI0036BBA827